MMLFSKRLELANKAEEWCKNHGAVVAPLGIVTALEALISHS